MQAAPSAIARWDGIRNYQARNFIRDHMARGDRVFIYHSQCKPTAIVGLAEVVTEPYPDPSQFDECSDYFDPKATTAAPRWFSVDIRLLEHFAQPLPLAQIKVDPPLANMALLKQARLSVVPVQPLEAERILTLCSSAKH